MRPSRKVQRKRRVNLTLLSAFFCCGLITTPISASAENSLLIAQQSQPQPAPYQAPPQQYQSAPPLQWQGQQPQGAPQQWGSQPAFQNGQWAPPQGQTAPVIPQNYSSGYPGGMPAPQQWQSPPPQGYAPQQGYPQGAPPANYQQTPAANAGYGAPPQYPQGQSQNWNYQNQQSLQGQAQQSYAPPPVQNSMPTPPPNEGYPSVEELNQTFQQNPANNVQQPSTAAKVGAGLLNMVKGAMTTPSYGMGMPGYGMGGYPMGGMGMPMGGYGMPYGAAPMGYPMMGSPGLMGAPMGGSLMNNILNNGLRNIHF
ncbi:MAG TPA: hypothetical protein PKZ32_08930 [Candidatus Melainabacteria bacterium]|nr:hypothetical protein [Candidatus Melainabacteria bacterium]